MKRKHQFCQRLSLLLASALAYAAAAGFPALADTPALTGSLTISKAVSGTGAPSAETAYTFSITKSGGAAIGNYSIDGAAAQAIPADGTIDLKAGQTATLTGLEPGEYLVAESSPTQDTYESTAYSVNGGAPQAGLSATVTVTAPAVPAESGWHTENGIPAANDDGYYVYTLTADQIAEDGTIVVDCNPLAEIMEASMRDRQDSVGFRVKFVNETGVAIQYKDYDFTTVNWIPVGETYTPSAAPQMLNTNEGASSTSAGYGWGEVWQRLYSFLYGQVDAAGSLDVKGFDGNNIRVPIAPLRCINPAVVSYFNSNPGKDTLTGNSSTNSAQTITLQQMNALPTLIQQAFTFKDWQGNDVSLPADSSRTYADFICAFYGVNSLDELTAAQKYNVLGTGSKGSPAMPYDGQSAITTYYSNLAGTMSNWCIPYAALNDGTLDYFKTWGFSTTRIEAGKTLKSGGQTFNDEDAATYAYQPNYYLLESDPAVLAMGYEYLYDRCIRFSFDTDNRPVPESIDNSSPDAEVSGLKSYLDKTDAANANVLAAMNNGEKIASGESIVLDRVRGYIEVPNAWNQFRYYDFGFRLTFTADTLPPSETSSVAFTNLYRDAATPVPSEVPILPTSTPTSTPAPTAAPTGTPMPDSTATPVPTAAATPSAVPTAAVTVTSPTATPAPTASPAPTAAPMIPQTADESSPSLWSILCLLALGGLLCLKKLFHTENQN